MPVQKIKFHVAQKKISGLHEKNSLKISLKAAGFKGLLPQAKNFEDHICTQSDLEAIC